MRSKTAPGTRRRMFIHTWKLLDSNFLFALKLHTHIADDDENGEDDRVDAMLVDAGTRPLHSEAERDSSKEGSDSHEYEYSYESSSEAEHEESKPEPEMQDRKTVERQ